MNRDCNGSFYQALGIYRCLGDGTIVRTQKIPDYCPHCKRPVRNIDEVLNPRLRVRTITTLQAWSEQLNTWFDIQTGEVVAVDCYSESFKDVGSSSKK